MRSCGLHLRLQESFLQVVQQAAAVQMPIFQCFLVSQVTHELLRISKEEKEEFLRTYRDKFKSLYLHGSYWINLATVKPNTHKVFFREWHLAQDLGFSHMVIHPGAATGGSRKQDGIDSLARALNDILARESSVKIVLENTTHAGLSVGGDLGDFRQLLERISYPDRLFFCVDTAHAHSFGYDLKSPAKQEVFVNDLEATMGIARIALIHLNDTKEPLGSKIDRHAAIGQGSLGAESLKQFVLHPRLRDIDIILELPVMPEDKEQALLAEVKSWHI